MELKTWVTIAARLLLALVALILLLRLLENMFVFFPEKAPANARLPRMANASLEETWLQTVDGTKVDGWLVTPTKINSPSPPTILYLHGNAGNLFGRAERLATFAAQGWRVFGIDYRGYGKSAGRSSEAGLYLDAAAAYEFLIREKQADPRTLFFYGESLGAAVAIQLALEHPCAGLILESAFLSFKDMGQTHYPLIPAIVYRFLHNEWKSVDRIKQIGSAKFFIHGDHDTVVPFDHGRRLFDAAPPPKFFYGIQGGDHNDCFVLGGNALLENLRDFVRRTRQQDVHPDENRGSGTSMEK